MLYADGDRRKANRIAVNLFFVYDGRYEEPPLAVSLLQLTIQ